jgi:hypothetical protein
LAHRRFTAAFKAKDALAAIRPIVRNRNALFAGHDDCAEH